MRKYIIAMVLAAAAYPSVAAIKGNANTLFEQCSDPLTEVVCTSFIIGYVNAYATWGRAPGPTLCIPDSVDHNQMKDIFMRFMVLNPQLRHLSAGQLIITSLAEAFPCRK